MKLSDRLAQFFKNVASRFDDQHHFRRLLDLTLPSIEAAGAGKNVHARGEAMFNQVASKLRSLFLGVACGEHDDLVSHHMRISLTVNRC